MNETNESTSTDAPAPDEGADQPPSTAPSTPAPIKEARQGLRPVFYPLLFACYPVFHFYARNAWLVPLGELRVPLQYALGVTAAVWLFLTAALRNVHTAALITALALALFATIEHAASAVRYVLEYLAHFWVARDCPVWAPPVMLLESAIFLFLVYRAGKLKNPRRWTPYLNFFGLILVGLPLTEILRVQSKMPERPPGVPPALAALDPPQVPPDIYYIILDGFARPDILRDTFGYDMEPILKRLEARGFAVMHHSTSNYCQTPLSLSSSLNGQYLEPPKSEQAMRLTPGREFFRDNAVYASLKPLGYQFILFASGFDFSDQPDAGTYLSPYPYVSNFHRMLAQNTPLWRWLPNAIERDSYTMTRDRTVYLFDMLPKVARWPGPKFTFAHVLSPHPPFVFGPNGEDVSPHAMQYYLSDGMLYREFYGDSEDQFIMRYRQQAEFIAKMVERAIDGILENSRGTPIIILQSDHGSGMNLYLGSAEKTDHRERMSILNAYYLPGGKKEGLHDTIMPVNTFRVIFNNYFGANLPLLPERNYYSTWDEPYRFIDVTDRVRQTPSTNTDGANHAAAAAE